MLDRFCCMRLNTFGVVIGWLGILSSILGVTFFTFALNSVLYESAIVCLVFSALNLVASALLIYGTIKERHLFMVPWLLNSAIALFVITLYKIVITILLIDSTTPVHFVVMALILSTLFLVLQIYIYYGILTLFRQIRNKADAQRTIAYSATESVNPSKPLYPVCEPVYPSYAKL